MHPGRRPETLAQAFHSGACAAGYISTYRAIKTYETVHKQPFDLVVFYGLKHGLLQVFRDLQETEGKTPIFLDLGYWNRQPGARAIMRSHHKIVIGDLHPNNYIMDLDCPPDRLHATKRFRPKPCRRSGSHIVLQGQSGKAAWVFGMEPEEYENQVVAILKQLTDRPIIYRPKDSFSGARPIEGTTFYRGPLEPLLKDCWCLVTHHSNSAVEALEHGVPAIVTDTGAAKSVSETSLTNIENPTFPDSSQFYRFMCNLAYMQWTPAEMSKGLPLAFFRDRGLLNAL